MGEHKRTIKTYVLRSGRIHEKHLQLFEEHKNAFIQEISDTVIDFEVLFGNSNNVILDVGFGMGHSLIELALQKPENNFLGVEVHKAGVVRVVREIVKNNISNIRIISGDAQIVIDKMLPPESISGLNLFFPDPWQKKKHHKRRMVNERFLSTVYRVLKSRGYFYFVSDWQDYANHVLELVKGSKLFSYDNDGFSSKQAWRPKTKYEEKGVRKEHEINEVFAIKHTGAQ